MNPLITIMISLLLLLPVSLAGLASLVGTCKSIAGVETTCKAAAAALSSVDYDFCVKSLDAVPDAKSADLQSLAAAAAKLAIAHSESAESKIEDLLDLELDPSARDKYMGCLDAYEDASDIMRDAYDHIVAGLYAKAARELRQAQGAQKKCEGEFEGAKGLTSPVKGEAEEYGKLAEIAAAVVSMVE